LAYIVVLALLANGRYLILEFRSGVEKITDRLTAYFAQPVGFGIGGSLLDVFVGQNCDELRNFLHYHLPLTAGTTGPGIREQQDNTFALVTKRHWLF
jgi:hypothetical protein